MFFEKMKKDATTCCCLDYNGALGTNLAEKVQVIYVTLVRMQYITRQKSKQLPDALFVHPVIGALLEVTGNLKANENSFVNIAEYAYAGRAWDRFDVYYEEESWMDHHILMTNLVDDKISPNPDLWCKVSLLNMIMANNFGYFNMCGC